MTIIHATVRIVMAWHSRSVAQSIFDRGMGSNIGIIKDEVVMDDGGYWSIPGQFGVGGIVVDKKGHCSSGKGFGCAPYHPQS